MHSRKIIRADDKFVMRTVVLLDGELHSLHPLEVLLAEGLPPRSWVPDLHFRGRGL